MEKLYEIKFHPEALKEFCNLDGSVKLLVKKQRFFQEFCCWKIIYKPIKGGDKFEDLLNLLEKSFTHIIIVKNL